MRILRKIGILLLVLIALRIVAAFVWLTINDVKTGGTPEYADLLPQRFSQPYNDVYAAALATARAMEWEVTGEDPELGQFEAVATTRVFRFKDDVTVTLRPEGAVIVVNVRSHSRIGKGDLGANARRIRLFQAELAKRVH